MEQLQKGFTLIELMIVVAIVGVLAVVAIPSYQDYIARAQVVEAIVILDNVKTKLTEYYAVNGTFPSHPREVGLPKLPSKYVEDLSFNLSGTGKWLQMRAEMRRSGVNANIQGKFISLGTSDGGKTWVCQKPVYVFGAGNMPAKYLPTSCK